MKSKFTEILFQITPELAGQRLDKALATCPEINSRSQATRLIATGMVSLEGTPAKASHVTKAGEEFLIKIPVIETEHLVPYDFPLDIVHEDQDLIVVNKPAGLVVHPACGHLQDTLVNALLHHTSDLSMGFNEKRPGLVHRIDKGTSGLLVIAKHDEAQRFLAKQFERKTTHRLYRAITFGRFKEKTGTITSHLKRHPLDRKRVASAPVSSDGSQDGKLAITHYAVIKEHPSGLSLVELRLETGRTHQIRVHLSEGGHPIAGDDTYGGVKRAKNLKSIELRKLVSEIGRPALHAAELGFVHPRTKERMVFIAPWPDDLLPLVLACEFE